jgi:glycerol-3-phosphate acyltransferase PlsY
VLEAMNAGEVAVAVVLALLSYVGGSIPFGVVVAKITGATDPRTLGSGRTGGTNALRAMGRRRALVVVTGDVLKGVVPVIVARVVTGNAGVEVACAIAAILGSTRSMFVGFKGGRGVGTSVGTMLVIFPPAILVGVPVFVGVILATRYVSLGSLLSTAAGALLVGIWWLAANGTVPAAYPLYATLGSILVWLAHADNINRLLHGTERRFDLDLLSRD